MRHRGYAMLVTAMALVSGCFQAEAPRYGAPAAAAAKPTGPQAGVERVIAIAEEEQTASVPELATILRDDADPEVRREAIYAIADVGKTEDAAIIGQALSDPDHEVRLAAIEALTGIGGETSAGWLATALGDPEARVRRTAVEALGQVGGDSARLALQQALSDADQDVRETAREMLDEPGRGQRQP